MVGLGFEPAPTTLPAAFWTGAYAEFTRSPVLPIPSNPIAKDRDVTLQAAPSVSQLLTPQAGCFVQVDFRRRYRRLKQFLLGNYRIFGRIGIVAHLCSRSTSYCSAAAVGNGSANLSGITGCFWRTSWGLDEKIYFISTGRTV